MALCENWTHYLQSVNLVCKPWPPPILNVTQIWHKAAGMGHLMRFEFTIYRFRLVYSPWDHIAAISLSSRFSWLKVFLCLPTRIERAYSVWLFPQAGRRRVHAFLNGIIMMLNAISIVQDLNLIYQVCFSWGWSPMLCGEPFHCCYSHVHSDTDW